jgi:hypothetical protein
MSHISPQGEKIKNKKELKLKKILKIGLSLVLVLMGTLIINTWSTIGDKSYAKADEKLFSNNQEIKFLINSEAKEILIPKEDAILNKIEKETLLIENSSRSELKDELYEMVGDSPIRDMIERIAQKDQRVAALLVGIAKKESSFGKASPSKEGKDCFNYWGYKGSASRGTGMGYACFGSKEEAVDIVGERIKKLVEKKLDTPAKMIVWKCGSSCAGHDAGAVKKWISDVEIYFNRIMEV